LTRANQLLAARPTLSEPTRPAAPTREAPRVPVAARPPAQNVPTTVAAGAPVARMHTISVGETLSGISRQYYGTSARWPEILAANRDILRDERSLIAGRTLRIP
jgi:nucleoid-associated protein YgaU